ncbi:hypothetical protein [Acetomicrobium sp. UBA5826]|uniref:hypothetical protein n=1 Tax=Acetomicrobium sp. UBA5826 TaxID=1946039 RepID=UPI00257D8287|nr:hypothetical protein [Acetomicrobium sp. UBA5826]
MEMDMVAHEGGNPSGEYALTLNLTDVSSGWTKLRAVKNKAQKWVFEALGLIRSRLPFPLLGLDSDNDSAFTTIICTIIARTKTSPSPGRGSQGKTTTASWSRRTGPSPEEPSGMQGMIRKKGAYHE